MKNIRLVHGPILPDPIFLSPEDDRLEDGSTNCSADSCPFLPALLPGHIRKNKDVPEQSSKRDNISIRPTMHIDMVQKHNSSYETHGRRPLTRTAFGTRSQQIGWAPQI